MTEFPTAFPAEFPVRYHAAFPARFPIAFSAEFPNLDADWLAPHHRIPNAKFPPITALLSRPTYHKSANVSPPPFPQMSWEPQINE